MNNMNETQKDLSQAHDAMEQKETLQDLQEQIKSGKVGINYETGEISGDKLNASSLAGSITTEDMIAEISKLQQEADPAILHLDVDLLQDVVLLSVSTALAGRYVGIIMHSLEAKSVIYLFFLWKLLRWLCSDK